MWFTKVGTPIATTDRKDGKFRDDNGGADRSCDFFGGLNAQADVTFGIPNNDDSLESSSLTGSGLLLDGFDLRSFR